MAELYKRYKALGAWAIEPDRRALTATQDAELIYVLYELELENARLKRAYPEVRMLWDADE